MRLETWMARHGVSKSDLARAIGVVPQMVTQVLDGKRNFGPKNILKIKELTGGRVTANDLIQDVPPQKRRDHVA